MAGFVFQAIRTSGVASVKLAMSLFDKQIKAILLYGSAIWAAPRTHNMIYVRDKPDNGKTRAQAESILRDVTGLDIPIISARKVGIKNGNLRSILINVLNYNDKLKILNTSSNTRYKIENYNDRYKTDIEKTHTDYMKTTLNVSKYASDDAVYCELGRIPIIYSAWKLMVKYWVRLSSGTSNIMLNNAYLQAKADNHPWVQSVQSILTENGMACSFNEHNPDKSNVHDLLYNRLSDQFVQNLYGSIRGSKRYDTLWCLLRNDGEHKCKEILTLVDLSTVLKKL